MAEIYYNGTIITMRGDEPEIVEAVLTDGGRILAAGTFEQAKKRIGELVPDGTYQYRDLEGMVMLPAFLDPHSHITAVAQVLGYASLSGVRSFDEILTRLLGFKEKAGLKPGEWIIGVGYDHNFLKENRHPDKKVLNRAFTDNPVMISHASGHMGVVNSLALEQMGITRKSPNPPGGVIGREDDGKEPSGYLEETAFTGAGASLPRPSMEKLARQMSMAEDLYLSHGIATIQDGITRRAEWGMLKYMAENHLFRADVISYVDMKSDARLISENPDYAKGYENHLRIGGYKIFLDGSPQGRTAWMSQPYEGIEGEAAGAEQTAAGEAAGKALGRMKSSETGYCGYPIYETEQVESFFETALRERRQLLVHCNGDAAAEQMIDACEAAAERTGVNPARIRPVMIHAQLVRDDELGRMAALSMTASFFTAHTYHWGDIHLKNFGKKRAFHISPARTAIEKNVNVTFHQDSPVIPPDMLETIWCAVSRVSQNGVVMGAGERISPYAALKAVTINAAYQYGEEKEKGTLEPGKRADFVLLSQNPLETAPEDLRKIKVLETIKSGNTLYRAKDPGAARRCRE